MQVICHKIRQGMLGMKHVFLAGTMLLVQVSSVWAGDGQYVEAVYVSIDGTGTGPITVQLQKGMDYVLFSKASSGATNGSAQVLLRNPQGQPTVTLVVPPATEQEFRAAYSATYTLEAQAVLGTSVRGWLYTDCRGDVKTKCVLGFAHSEHGNINLPADRDWYRSSLVKGRTYRFTLSSEYQPFYLTLRDKNGRLLVRHVSPIGGGEAFINMKATYTGPYFVASSAADQIGSDYDLSVQQIR